MFIKRVTLSSFGRLNGSFEFAPERCNIVCEENEFGKSTLADAILYSFYGFPATGFKREDLKPRERYKPWAAAAGNFTTEIELFDLDGKHLLLNTDFSR